MTPPILVAKNEREFSLLPQMANRHGLIAGATGTGKTVTLQGMAEAFSRRGVPVFMADVKGDLAGICQPGGVAPKLVERARQLGAITPQQRQQVVQASVVFGTYEKVVDRESAYERLKGAGAVARQQAPAVPGGTAQQAGGGSDMLNTMLGGATRMLFGGRSAGTGRTSQGMVEMIAKSAMRSVGSRIGSQIVRGMLGSILGGTTRRR
jgi:hypothetical protein